MSDCPVCRTMRTATVIEAGLHDFRRAFTLIETLLALALAGTVLALATRIAANTLRARQAVADRIDAAAHVDYLVDALAADLAARRIDSSDAVTVLLDAHRRPMLQIRCLAAAPNSGLHAVYLPAHVQYRLVRVHEESPSLELERVVHWQVDRQGSPISRQTICRELERFDIDIHDGHHWIDPHSEPIPDDTNLAAVRVRFRQIEDASDQIRTFPLRSLPSRRPTP